MRGLGVFQAGSIEVRSEPAIDVEHLEHGANHDGERGYALAR